MVVIMFTDTTLLDREMSLLKLVPLCALVLVNNTS